MKLGLINKSKHGNPTYKTTGSSGMDIRAKINEAILLNPGERVTIPTGLYLEIPNNYMDKRVFIYCNTGRRSSISAKILQSLGYKYVEYFNNAGYRELRKSLIALSIC